MYCKDAYERGVKYYADNFFHDDGTAKYFHDRTLPIDVHSYAQAIVFFSRYVAQQADHPYRKLVDRVAARFLDSFRDPSGFFYFQQKRKHMIKIPYMRWSQSWSLHALTEYLLVNHDSQGQKASSENA